MIQFQQAPVTNPANVLTEALEARAKLQEEAAEELKGRSGRIGSSVFLSILTGVALVVTIGAFSSLQGPPAGDTDAAREFSSGATALSLFFGIGFSAILGVGATHCWWDVFKHNRRAKEITKELGTGV